jgi:fatty-acyl-CoA synthase
VIAVGDPTVVTADAVLGACCATLADYKLPRYLVVRAEPLPRNMSGKVLKRELQRTYSESADLGDPLR